MPTIETYSPLSTGLDTAAAYLQQKKQNTLDAQTSQLQQAVVNSQLQSAASQRQHQVFTDQRAANADIEQAKVDAATILHQQRDDALRLAQVQNAATKNKQAYDVQVRKINAAHTDALAKIKGAHDVATIHASATLGAAQIHAAASVEAAGIHAGSEERGQDLTHNDRVAERGVIKRGQDLAHADRDRGQDLTNTRGSAAHISAAMLRLQTSKTPLAPPTDDPKFNQALQIFSKASPQARDEMLKHPGIPDSTRAYLQAISPYLP